MPKDFVLISLLEPDASKTFRFYTLLRRNTPKGAKILSLTIFVTALALLPFQKQAIAI